MRKLAGRLHARMGDFWWYSLMLFAATRAADLLNAFVGLWLVPKFVSPDELGAVMPLATFAAFLSFPAVAFANTFRNEVSRLSVNGEFGKLKSLMRGVFVATAVFLVFAVAVAHFTLPAFLERIRIQKGMLGVIIVTASFLGMAAPVYGCAMQALKKFRQQSIINIVTAPVRFLAMVVTMPFRPLSGYFVGQASVPSFLILGSVVCLRKELSVKAEPYWDRSTARKFISIFAVFLAAGLATGLFSLVETTVIRQRLPALDSAGYYMATRFSEISGFLIATLTFTIFPFSAEKAASGGDFRPIVFKSLGVNAVFCAALALAFGIFGKPLLALLPYGEQYSAYWWAIPWLIAIGYLAAITGIYMTAQLAARRFAFLKWMIPFDLAYPALLAAVTGYGHFTGFIPASWTEFLAAHNVRSLETMLWWMLAANAVKAACCLLSLLKSGPSPAPCGENPPTGARRA